MDLPVSVISGSHPLRIVFTKQDLLFCFTTTETGVTVTANLDRNPIPLYNRSTTMMRSTTLSYCMVSTLRKFLLGHQLLRWQSHLRSCREQTNRGCSCAMPRCLRRDTLASLKDRIPALFADWARIAAGEPRGRVPCIAPDLESAKRGSAPALFPDLHAYESSNGINECGGPWQNWVTEQTQLHMLEFEAQTMIHRIAPTPLLMVVPGNDVTVRTSSQLAAFGKAREPKELVFLDKAGHFDVYRGECFKGNIAAQIEFLKAHLNNLISIQPEDKPKPSRS